jgi:hypothetical protein
VVSTFRQTSGRSATGVNTPTITGPFTITAAPVPGGAVDPYSTLLNGGPSLSEATSADAITGTPQTVPAGTPECDGTGSVPAGFQPCQGGVKPNTSSFGQSGGVFAMGIAPYNAQAETGQAWSYAPYGVPIFGANHVAFIPWGGPPAFDPNGTKLGERDGVGSINGVDNFGNPYFLGVAEGVTFFDGVTVHNGTYSLSLAISTLSNGGSVSTSTLSKTATMTSTAVLPPLTAPVVTPDANGDGGASFTASLPAGVSEAYVQIVDYGPAGGPNNPSNTGSSPFNCQGARGTAFAPVYYTLHITNAAAQAYSLAPSIGPNLATTGGTSNIQPSPTICTAAQNTSANGGTATPADDFIVQMIGFDYPIYQAALGLTQASTPENPPISGSAGQSDLTISLPMEQDAGGAPIPAVRREPGAVRRRIPR